MTEIKEAIGLPYCHPMQTWENQEGTSQEFRVFYVVPLLWKVVLRKKNLCATRAFLIPLILPRLMKVLKLHQGLCQPWSALIPHRILERDFTLRTSCCQQTAISTYQNCRSKETSGGSACFYDSAGNFRTAMTCNVYLHKQDWKFQ